MDPHHQRTRASSERNLPPCGSKPSIGSASAKSNDSASEKKLGGKHPSHKFVNVDRASYRSAKEHAKAPSEVFVEAEASMMPPGFAISHSWVFCQFQDNTEFYVDPELLYSMTNWLNSTIWTSFWHDSIASISKKLPLLPCEQGIISIKGHWSPSVHNTISESALSGPNTSTRPICASAGGGPTQDAARKYVFFFFFFLRHQYHQ